MTIGVNCGPVAYSKLLKAEASEKPSRTLTSVGVPGRRWMLGGMHCGDERPPVTNGLGS